MPKPTVTENLDAQFECGCWSSEVGAQRHPAITGTMCCPIHLKPYGENPMRRSKPGRSAASGHGSDTKQSPLVTAAQLDSPEGRAAYARYLVSVGREAEIPYLVGESVRLEAGLGPIREAVDSADELPIDMPWHLLEDGRFATPFPYRRGTLMTCGIHTCKMFGQRPRIGLWLHNLVFHRGK